MIGHVVLRVELDAGEAAVYVSTDVIALCIGERVAIAHPRWLSAEQGGEVVRALLAVMPAAAPAAAADPLASCDWPHPTAAELVCALPRGHEGEHHDYQTGMRWTP